MTTALTGLSSMRPDSPAYVGLQRALDMETFWHSCLDLMGQALPYTICSLFSDISDYEARRARHHVVRSTKPDYVPANSLTVAGPYLDANPLRRVYTYSEICESDPQVQQRRLAQEPDPEWDEFVQMAFWRDDKLEAILGLAWKGDTGGITSDELRFLEVLYPVIDASLYRLRALEAERVKSAGLESALNQIPLAVMMVGFTGNLLFANPEAKRQCERWNAALGHRSVRLKLPEDIDDLLESQDGLREGGSVSIAHPYIPDFSVRISVSWHTPGLQARPCYVVLFQSGHNDALQTSSGGGAPSDRSELLQKLSPKERRVALMVAEGLRNEDIAQRLCRSRRTIEFQLASVYRKLDLNNRLQLIKLLG